jgi:hypothetical protein
MTRQLLRLIALLMLALATIAPASIIAQDAATPDASPAATPVAAPGVGAAVSWLIDQQQEDGSWLGHSGDPDVGTTIDAVVALAAAREADIDVGDSIENALGWLDESDATEDYAVNGPGSAAKLVLGLVAVGQEPLEIAGISPLDIVLKGHDPNTDLYGFGLYDHAYALMALAATDSDIPAEVITVLDTMQAGNGGFAWDGSTDEAMSDSNTTAMIVQALVAAGEGENDIVARAIGYLRLTVNEQGAGYNMGAEADANSTALVAQAYLAVGEDATHLLTTLTTFQNATGAYFWMHTDVTDNVFTTTQVIPAVSGIALPVTPGMLELEEAA